MRFSHSGPLKRGKPTHRLGLPGVARKRARRRPARPSWKLVGLAGIAGVAATGVLVARSRRAHRELEPDELRDRLHSRLAQVSADAPPAPQAQSD